MSAAIAPVPLLSRAPTDILFRLPDRTITAASFLAAATRMAEVLPDAPFVVNLCHDRFHFAVTFAASLLRGQTSLLTSDRSASFLRGLKAAYPGAWTLSDEPAPYGGGVLPHAQVDAVGSLPESVFSEDLFQVPSLPAERVVARVFTSGSTGAPVAHAKSWGALASRSIAAGAQFELRAASPACIAGMVPPQHMYGFETTVLWPLHAPLSVWCGPAFFPGDVQAALAAMEAPRILVTTPLQIRALVQSGLALPPIAAAISATAPLEAPLAEAAERLFGADFLEIYGATEVGSIASRRTVAGDAWRLYPGIRLLAEGPDIVVHAPDAVPHCLGDRIEMLEDGRFRLLGRLGDMVKLAGRRASLAGLTALLNGIPGVIDGVFAPPPDLDHRPTARMLVFAVAPGLSAEAVLAALRGCVDPVFLPRRVVLLDRLPRNAAGKLTRQARDTMLADLAEP